MATNNLIVRDVTGALRTLTAIDTTGSGGPIAMQHVVVDPTATYSQPTLDNVARAGYVTVTDGTNTMPTMDVAGRAGFVKVTDGTHTITVKAASTAALITDTSLVVALNPNTPVVTNADGSITGGTAASKSLLAGGQFLAYGSLPALTTGQQASLQTDPASNLKVAVSPLGTPIYGTSNGGAAANNVTLTIPAAKMGYLDFVDIDGLGATSGSAVAVTIAGVLGGALTYQIGIPAGVTTPITPVRLRCNPPLQASATGTNFAISVASFGSGNTAASTNAGGHYV